MRALCDTPCLPAHRHGRAAHEWYLRQKWNPRPEQPLPDVPDPYRYQCFSVLIRCSCRGRHYQTGRIRYSILLYICRSRSQRYIRACRSRIFRRDHNKSQNRDRRGLNHAPRSCLPYQSGKSVPVQCRSRSARLQTLRRHFHKQTDKVCRDPVQQPVLKIPSSMQSPHA